MHRILLIDDSPQICDCLRTILEHEGDYEVLIAHNGKDGLKIARKRPPDLVLLDIIMPEMDGFEVLQSLKNNRKLRRIPVIMLTARQDKDALRQSMYLYADQFITKPINTDVLVERVKHLLGGASAE